MFIVWQPSWLEFRHFNEIVAHGYIVAIVEEKLVLGANMLECEHSDALITIHKYRPCFDIRFVRVINEPRFVSSSTAIKRIVGAQIEEITTVLRVVNLSTLLGHFLID